jgi:hypothetical protein
MHSSRVPIAAFSLAAVSAAALSASVAAQAVAQTVSPSAAPAPSPAAAPVVLPHLTLSPELLAGLPRTSVTAQDESGKSAIYSGVELDMLLAKNGAPHGEAIRGRAVADYVVVRASDGYRAVFALVELDARFTNKVVLVADQRDGAPLGADGPFRLVVPDEKHHARWVRNAVEIEVRSAP